MTNHKTSATKLKETFCLFLLAFFSAVIGIHSWSIMTSPHCVAYHDDTGWLSTKVLNTHFVPTEGPGTAIIGYAGDGAVIELPIFAEIGWLNDAVQYLPNTACQT